MIFHGTVVLIIGLVAGVPYGQAIARGEARKAEAWRAAHTGMCATGVMMLAMGAALHAWGPPGATAHTVTWAVALGSYCIALAMTLAAATGERGLRSGGSGPTRSSSSPTRSVWSGRSSAGSRSSGWRGGTTETTRTCDRSTMVRRRYGPVASIRRPRSGTKSFLRAELADLRGEMAAFRAEVRSELAALETKLTVRMGAAMGALASLMVVLKLIG